MPFGRGNKYGLDTEIVILIKTRLSV